MTVRYDRALARGDADRTRLIDRQLPPTFFGCHFVKRFFSVRVLALGAIAACGPHAASVPTPKPEPTTTPVAPVEAPTVVRYSVPGLVTDTRYRIESVTELERDSAGRRETQTLNTQANVTLRLRRTATGAFTANGQIAAYQVKSQFLAKPISIDSLRFQAVLDAQALRVVMQPPLANECDRAETGALALVHDVLLRVPASLAVGDQWRDSTVQVICRSTVPLVFRTVNDYVLTSADRARDGNELVVRRTSVTRVEGKTSSPWRAVEISGVGADTLSARISVLTGAVRSVEGKSILTLLVSDRSSTAAVRAQQLTQRVKLTGTASGN